MDRERGTNSLWTMMTEPYVGGGVVRRMPCNVPGIGCRFCPAVHLHCHMSRAVAIHESWDAFG